MFRNDEILLIPCGFGEYGERIIYENSQEREKSGEKVTKSTSDTEKNKKIEND